MARRRGDPFLEAMEDPSATAVVHNPILALPAFRKLQALDPEAREALYEVLMELHDDGLRRVDKAWSEHKGPMAVYWRGVGVYAQHIARAIRWKPKKRRR